MFKAVIIEDEFPARVTLKSFLRRYFDTIEVVAEIDTVEESIAFLKTHKTDIVFLDVQLKDGKGIEVLEAIDSEKYKIIFTTAHEEYAIKAFQHMAFGYLLKPLDPDDFREILSRVLKDLGSIDIDDSTKKIKIPINQGYKWVDLKDIVRCEAESNYTKIFIQNVHTPFTISKTLKFVEHELINSEKFIRVHQSHLINSTFIKNSEIKNNAITLINGDTIPVSRSKRFNLFGK